MEDVPILVAVLNDSRREAANRGKPTTLSLYPEIGGQARAFNTITQNPICKKRAVHLCPFARLESTANK
jgi:hypothetical protein